MPAVYTPLAGGYSGAFLLTRSVLDPAPLHAFARALLAAWTARNIAICARLVQSAQPGDRVLVVYGAGHSFLLRQCVQQMPGWLLVEPDRKSVV